MSAASYHQKIKGATPDRAASNRGVLTQEAFVDVESSTLIGIDNYKGKEERGWYNKGDGPLPPELHRSKDEARRYVRDTGMNNETYEDREV